MKIGSVLRLRNKHHVLAANHGWLWVYEGPGEHEDHSFRAVATGYSGCTAIPSLGFENWGEDNDAG